MAKLIVTAGRELFGYLQVALQGVHLDRQVLPACQGNGFEAWRLLRERFRPQTSGGVIAELQEIIWNTNLYKAETFELGLHEWEKRVQRFKDTFGMTFPEQL
eukprot:5508937-Alexandrium_andersonii.AAC.1